MIKFTLNMIKFTWALSSGETTKVEKKQIMRWEALSSLSVWKRVQTFKRYTLYNGEKPGFSLANRKCNFSPDYCGNCRTDLRVENYFCRKGKDGSVA